MTKGDKQFIMYALIALFVGIAGVIVINSIFKSPKTPDTKMYQEAMKAKDETIRVLTEQKQELARQRDLEMQQFEQARLQDSTIMVEFIKHQQVYTTINQRYNDIRKKVQNIAGNNDSIRSAFKNF